MSARSIVEAQLDRLLWHWERIGAPVAGMLAPGLTDQEMDDLTGPTGFVLNDELRAWWGWRNGVPAYDADRIRRPERSIWEGDHQFPSLSHAIDLTHQYFYQGDQAFTDEWVQHWRPWILFIRSNGKLLAGPGRRDPRDPSPVMSFFAQDSITEQAFYFTNISDMLALWPGLFDNDLVHYNPDTSTNDGNPWVIAYDKLSYPICDRI